MLNRPVVLVVEDEFLVRTTQVDILRDAGFWVLEAEDADEAFEILKKRPETRVVITDVEMPGSLDGFEFARLVEQGWPAVGVLVISGRRGPHPGDMPRRAVFVTKPLRAEDLVRQVQSLMTASG